MARLAGHRDQPSCCLHQRVVSGLLLQRPDVAVRADGAVDEARVSFLQSRRAEAELVGETGAEALEEDVRSVDEPKERIAATRVAQRQRE